MDSLIILMIEEEQPEGLSARKLVAESAKHNVITAYSAEHGLHMLKRFPLVDAVLVHAGILSRHKNLVDEVRALVRGVPVILANPYGTPIHADVDHVVDSHRPEQLLNVLKDKIRSRAGMGTS